MCFYSSCVVNGSVLMQVASQSSVLAAVNAQDGICMRGRMLPVRAAVLAEFMLAIIPSTPYNRGRVSAQMINIGVKHMSNLPFDPHNAWLGLELGSTRIKAVLIDRSGAPLASGSHTWESQLENGYWTYPLSETWHGIAACYAALKRDVQQKYGVTLTMLAGIGISGMMHGYLPFDAEDRLLTPFRTWRNLTTADAAAQLTALFGFNIPQRWSIAHLYQAMLSREEHVPAIRRLTTLAGEVHYRLTGCHVLGVGEASGMFPVDPATGLYDARMMAQFDALAQEQPWKLSNLLPRPLMAGACAGTLTAKGARLLDRDGDLLPGIPLCPPEGDAGTGMTATNAIAPRTGNVSAGTSIFAMVVLEKALQQVHPEIDVVATPAGKAVAMVHCNNGTSDINAYAGLFSEVLSLMGHTVSMDDLFTRLYEKSLEGAPDCSGVTVYNYLAGEHVTGFAEGRPMIVRRPDAPLTLADFMRANLYSTLASLAAGMRILRGENVVIDRLTGHGGYFKTPGVGQKYLAAATGSSVHVLNTAGEGGPYGMALLALYQAAGCGRTLEQFLEDEVFAGVQGSVVEPDTETVQGFAAYLTRFLNGLPAERAAVELL